MVFRRFGFGHHLGTSTPGAELLDFCGRWTANTLHVGTSLMAGMKYRCSGATTTMLIQNCSQSRQPVSTSAQPRRIHRQLSGAIRPLDGGGSITSRGREEYLVITPSADAEQFNHLLEKSLAPLQLDFGFNCI